MLLYRFDPIRLFERFGDDPKIMKREGDSLSRIRSLADYTIITREFEFSEATRPNTASTRSENSDVVSTKGSASDLGPPQQCSWCPSGIPRWRHEEQAPWNYADPRRLLV